MRTHIGLSICVLVLSAAPASATDYFVRASGSNGNTGLSPAQAWATVAYAADQAGAGDTVYVGAGTYDATITPANDGTALNPIRFVADTGGTQTGDAGTVTLSRAANFLVLDVTGDDYVEFVGFTIDGGNTGRVVEWTNATGGLLDNCTIIGGNREQVTADDADLEITGCSITGSEREGISVQDASTVTVRDTVISNCADEGINVENAASALIADRVTISGVDWGISMATGSATVTNSLIYDITNEGVVIASSASTIVLWHITFDNIGTDGVSLTTGAVDVYNCIFSNITDDGMDQDGGTITASNNLFYTITGSYSEGFDSPNEYAGNPHFLNPSAGDYRLSGSSVAISLGLDASAVTVVDRLGIARPYLGGWDLGAYESANIIVRANVPYATDFEAGAGLEWEDGVTSTTAGFTQFLGNYGLVGATQESTSLHLNVTAGTEYYLVFDLHIIDDWEGAGAGADDFNVAVDGTQVFSETFENAAGSYTYPGSPIVFGTDLGFVATTDAIYRYIAISFTPAGSTTEIAFQGIMTTDTSNESWGLDNVNVVEAVDLATVLPVFADITASTGFGVTTTSSSAYASGMIWGDLNSDGYPDAIAGGSSATRFMNDGDRTFTATTLGNIRRQIGLADLDNDNDLDLWAVSVNSFNTERAYLNDGTGTFANAGHLGLNAPTNNESAVLADTDADGRTDIVMFSGNGNWIGTNDGGDPVTITGSASFTSGLNDPGDYGNGDFVSSADVNSDGFPDFFYHYNAGKLFLSNGDGTYTHNNGGISVTTGNSDKMGSAWGDYDNDGDMDLFVSRFASGQPGYLWRNNGGSFTNVASSAGITDTSSQVGCAWGDYDNDGDLDLYIATTSGSNVLYTNNGDTTFTQEDRGSAISGAGQDAVFVDCDNDGDLDLALSHAGTDAVLLQNIIIDDRYLKVRVLGAGSGKTAKAAVGVRVEVWDAANTTFIARREIGASRGLGGAQPIWLHFGGLDPATTYTVRTYFTGDASPTAIQLAPATTTTTIASNTIQQMLTVVEPPGVRVVRWREVNPVDE